MTSQSKRFVRSSIYDIETAIITQALNANSSLISYTYFLSLQQIRMRSMIIQQLKDLKCLEETGVLTTEQFKQQREKLLEEMTNLK